MCRSFRAVILAAALCLAIPAGSASAEIFVPAQLTGPPVQVAEATKTAVPQPNGQPLPGEPAAIEAPVVEEEMSEAAIVLLGAAMGLAGIVAFHHTGQWMHRRLAAKQQAQKR